MNDNKPLSSPGSLARSVSTYEILVVIKKRKWIYLTFILLAGILSFTYLKTRVLRYSSTASFYLNDNPSSSFSSGGAETRAIDQAMTSENFNRVYQLIYSTKVYKHLIGKFSLYKHYEIDSTNEFGYEKLIAILKRRIDVKRTQFALVNVTVEDPYRYLAANMANEIVSYVDLLNKDIIIQGLKIKLNIYKTLINELQVQSSLNTHGFDSLLKELNVVIPRLEAKNIASANLVSLQQKLGMLTVNMENSELELLRLQRYYSLALETINLQSLPTLTVMQEALPSPYSISRLDTALALSVMILATMILLISLYWELRYGQYISLLLKS